MIPTIEDINKIKNLPPIRRKDFDELDEDQKRIYIIIYRFRYGFEIRVAARALGISEESFRKLFRDLGLRADSYCAIDDMMRNRKNRNDYYTWDSIALMGDDELKELFDYLGYTKTIDEIAEHFGVDVAEIKKLKDKLGFHTNMEPVIIPKEEVAWRKAEAERIATEATRLDEQSIKPMAPVITAPPKAKDVNPASTGGKKVVFRKENRRDVSIYATNQQKIEDANNALRYCLEHGIRILSVDIRTEGDVNIPL